jgi:hypothetical protein
MTSAIDAVPALNDVIGIVPVGTAFFFNGLPQHFLYLSHSYRGMDQSGQYAFCLGLNSLVFRNI